MCPLRRDRSVSPRQAAAAALALLLTTTLAGCRQDPSSTQGTADEIKYSFGNTARTVVFAWHGTERRLYFGRTRSYGQRATAVRSEITPQDGDQQYLEAELGGLAAGRRYHYKIGPDGIDRVFQTVPSGSFTWVDVGDTMSTSCHSDGSWMPAEHRLIAAQRPSFVTHGGDIAVPNQCGKESLHQYFVDQQRWSTGAAFQPVWGDHEWEGLLPGSPSDGLADSNSNYKGRVALTNAQTSPADTLRKTTHPGCGEATGSASNTCPGEDWGWFRAGGVLFISYPETSWHSWDDWGTRAGALMARAQQDAAVDFIVTYGHRPPYSSSTIGPYPDARRATQALAAAYSPTTAHPRGKYVLNIAHHAHSMEAFRPIGGLTHVVDAAGGQGLTRWADRTDPRSSFRSMHLGLLRGDYDAGAGRLTVRMICGPRHKWEKSRCSYGDTLYTTSFTRVR